MKRLLPAVLAAACALLLPVTAYAAAGLPPSSLTVVMEYGGTALEGIHVSVCLAAEAVEENGAFTSVKVFTAAEAFAGAGADFTDLTTERNIALSARLDAWAAANNIARSSKTTDRAGKAVFDGLPAGLYLVAQSGGADSEYTFAPFLAAVPGAPAVRGRENGVTAYPKMQRRDAVPGAPEKTLVNGGKHWEHGANPEGKQPKSIDLRVYADGVFVLQKRITEAEHWSWSLRMDKYDRNGKEIVYTVDEAPVYSYVKTVDGFNLINTFITLPGTAVPGTAGNLRYNLPRTGDLNDPALWLALLALSSVGLAAIILCLRRYMRHEKKYA